MTTTPVPNVVDLVGVVADGLWAGLMQLSPSVMAIPAGLFALEMGWKLFQRLTEEGRSEKHVISLYSNAIDLREAGCYGQSRAEERRANRAASKHEARYH